MRAAADVSRRDVIPQAWLLGRNLQSGDLAQAMSRLDLIFRTQNSTISAKLVSLLLRSSAMTIRGETLRSCWNGASALAIELSRPSVSGGARPECAVSALYSALGESPAPPLTEELRPFLDRLIREGQVEEAYVAWMQSCPRNG